MGAEQMSRKGENIYRRKDGRWEGRYIRGRKQDGKAVFLYKKFVKASSFFFLHIIGLQLIFFRKGHCCLN